jgi:hypothetical protein
MLIMSKNRVDFETLMGVETPEATDSHMPIPHHTLVVEVRKAIAAAGLTVLEEEHGLARGGLRYFGGFAVTGKGIDGEDRQVVIGVRNSHDKAFAAAICIGNRMLVCDNLCFSSDVKLARRHTLNIMADLPRVIADAMGRVLSHWNDMTLRIERYKATAITESQAADLLVRLVDTKVFPKSKLYDILVEFRKPRHDEFAGENLWNLYNAVTEFLKGSDQSKLPFRTMTMQSNLDPIAHHVPEIEVQEIVTKGCEDNPEPDGTDLRD